VRLLYSFPDGIGRPGIGTTAYHQVREVAAQGVDVLLYCTSVHRELPENVRVVRTLSIRGRRVPHRVMGVDRTYRYHDLRVAAALRRIGSTIDLVHTWPRATVHTSRAAHRHGIPCLREVPNTHTAHALAVVAREAEKLSLPADRGYSHAFSRKTLALEDREYDLADRLLVPSEYSRQTFVDCGVPPEKLVLHRYGYDAERFFTPPDVTEDGERPFTAIFVGRCEPRKGLHYALRAWIDSGAAESGRFVICGAFEPGYREVVAPLLEHPSVEVHGFVPDPSALMRESDIFVFPSIEEGSALVTYEAQASGCALLVSDAAGAACEHLREGLVHPAGDVATLTQHLRTVDRDRELLIRLRRQALANSAGLTWTAAGELLVDAYAGVLNGRADSSPRGRTVGRNHG
jgi:glycosyltransferase involved in cell wall biosynthesis